MNASDVGQPEDYPPPWFTNEDDVEAEHHARTLWRWLIGAGVLAIVAVLLLIPVLQAEVLQRRREALPDAATERTAVLFASAMLFGRSEGQAMIFAEDGARDDVRGTLRRLVNRQGPSRQARLQVVSAPCSRESAEHCYQGRILDPGSDTSGVIRFGLVNTQGGPRIVWVEIDELVALGGLPEAMRHSRMHSRAPGYWHVLCEVQNRELSAIRKRL